MSFDLNRFVKAQLNDYPQALAEVRQGCKVSHWMWYIFPQLRGLGFSSTAVFYGIEDLEEARAYLEEPSLNHNLREITQSLLELDTSDPVRVFGSIDAKKLRSCMTLFAHATPDNALFLQVLDKYYGGRQDRKTLELLGLQGEAR